MRVWRPLRRAGSCCLLLLAVGTAAGGKQPSGATAVLAGVWAPPAIAPVWQAVRPWMQHIEREVGKVDDFVVYVLDDTADRIARVDEQAIVRRVRAAWSAMREAVEPAGWPGWLPEGAAGAPPEAGPPAGVTAGEDATAGGSDLGLPVMTRTSMADQRPGPGGPPVAAGPAGEAVASPMTDLLPAAGGSPAAGEGDEAGQPGAAPPAAQGADGPEQGPQQPGETAGGGDGAASQEERAAAGSPAARSRRDGHGVTAASAAGGAREDGAGRDREEAGWQEAVASWYGPGFYGRPTASGEIFTGRDFTAAHRTLPFGTILRVYYPVTDRTVEVRINDRGPFVPGRDLDLAEAAAEALGMISAGVARVRYQIVGRVD